MQYIKNFELNAQMQQKLIGLGYASLDDYNLPQQATLHGNGSAYNMILPSNYGYRVYNLTADVCRATGLIDS